MAAHHQYPIQTTFQMCFKLLAQMPLDIALGLIESRHAYECEIAQSYLKIGNGSGDHEALLAYFQACTGAEIQDPSDPHPVPDVVARPFGDLPGWTPAALAIAPPA
eukprot:5888063-Pyramimonas_sp.AAC.1